MITCLAESTRNLRRENYNDVPNNASQLRQRLRLHTWCSSVGPSKRCANKGLLYVNNTGNVSVMQC